MVYLPLLCMLCLLRLDLLWLALLSMLSLLPVGFLLLVKSRVTAAFTTLLISMGSKVRQPV